VRRAGAFVLLLAACNNGASSGVTALHDLHQPSTPVNVPSVNDDYYTLPFPNELHFSTDGKIDLSTYPRAGGILDQYVDAFADGIRGAGTNSGIFFRFDGAIDPATLPADVNASLADSSSAILVDITEGSPTYGKRTPLLTHYVETSQQFIGPFSVTLLPYPGFPLREKTTYAAILTDGLKAAGGATIHRARDLDAALAPGAASSTDARLARAGQAYAPLDAWLATQPGLAAKVVNATVFTTGDFTSVMTLLRQAVYDQAPAPTLADLKYDGEDVAGVDQKYEGTYVGPNFQQGTPPYQQTGGAIVFDANGKPKVDHMETLRVAMTIPEGQIPAAGWPVVIYAHGTGGDYMSFIGDGSGREAAKVTAADGTVISQMAMIATDLVLNGARVPPGTNVDLAFVNVLNPVAARANPQQGALDEFQVVRLIQSINVAAAPTTGQPIKFDVDRIYFKGHSEGGLTGPLFCPFEPAVKAAIYSGAGAGLIQAALNKTQPVDLTKVIGALLMDPPDQFHPALSLLSNYLDGTDPENYARLQFKEPPAGGAPKNIFHTLGLVDHYTPVPVIKTFVRAMGTQPVGPMLDPIDALDLAGLSWGTAPVQLNVAGGAATGVSLEYKQAGTSDGHFVIFDVQDAIKQSNRFLATHAKTGVARLDPP
jgi:hypothetical protein